MLSDDRSRHKDAHPNGPCRLRLKPKWLKHNLAGGIRPGSDVKNSFQPFFHNSKLLAGPPNVRATDLRVPSLCLFSARARPKYSFRSSSRFLSPLMLETPPIRSGTCPPNDLVHRTNSSLYYMPP